MQYASQLDKIKPLSSSSSSLNSLNNNNKLSSFPDHLYASHLKHSYSTLYSLVLSYMVQSVNSAISTDSPNNIDQLFQQMPILWVRRVMECDVLCVVDEFDRYLLAKRVAVTRRKSMRAVSQQASSSSSSNKISFLGLKSRSSHDKDDGLLSPEGSQKNKKGGVSRLFGSLFGGGGGGCVGGSNGINISKQSPNEYHQSSAKKLKRDNYASSLEYGVASWDTDGFDYQFSGLLHSRKTTNDSQRSGLSVSHGPGLANLYGELGLAQTQAEEDEDGIIISIFQNAITYTFMTFPQLERVRADKIVSDTIVLQSFWMQTELSNRPYTGLPSNSESLSSTSSSDALPPLKPYRFAARFRNVREFFDIGGSSLMSEVDLVEQLMTSETTKCAGVDYRILLSLTADDVPTSSPIPISQKSSNSSFPFSNLFKSRRVSMHSIMSISSSSVSENSTHQEELQQQQQHRVASPSKFHDNNSTGQHVVLKAHLQRHRTTAGHNETPTSTESTMNAKTSSQISYSIYVYDVGKFRSSSNSESWKMFHKPVTACDFECNGHVKGFSLPESSKAVSNSNSNTVDGGDDGADGSGDLWVIVKLDLMAPVLK
jgi:hypothetical protein